MLTCDIPTNHQMLAVLLVHACCAAGKNNFDSSGSPRCLLCKFGTSTGRNIIRSSHSVTFRFLELEVEESSIVCILLYNKYNALRSEDMLKRTKARKKDLSLDYACQYWKIDLVLTPVAY